MSTEVSGTSDLWTVLMALAALLLPLLLAWWLVGRGLRRPTRDQGKPSDNGRDRRHPH